MKKKSASRRNLRQNINLLTLNMLFSELRFYFPVAVLSFQSVTGSYLTAMGVFSVSCILQGLLEVPTGILSDRWGRRATLIIGSLIEVLAIFCYTLAFSSPEPLLPLYIGAMFYGLANALFSGNNHAMLYETLAYYRCTKETAKILGRLGTMEQLGLFISSIVAIILLWLGWDYENLMVLTLVSLSLATLTAFLTIEPPKHLVQEKTSWAHMKKAWHLLIINKKLRLLSIASIVWSGGGIANYYVSPSFIASVWPLWLVPFYRTLQHAVGMPSFWFSGHIIKKWGAFKALFYGSLTGSSISLVAYALSNFSSPLLMTITQSSYALSTTANNTVQQENFSTAQRSTMSSLIAFFSTLMTGVGSLFLGWLVDISSPAIAMSVFMVMRVAIAQPIYYRLMADDKAVQSA